MSESSSSLLQELSQTEDLSRRGFVLGVGVTTLLTGLSFKPDIKR